MKLVLIGFACIALAGCTKMDESAGETQRSAAKGRYAGVGVFDAGRLWGKMIVPPGKGDDSTARLADDEHVIVVVDSQTGEVRQCGDHSGYCVSIAPWSAANSTPTLPAKLSIHNDQLDAQPTENAAPIKPGK
jgi:hypothetical protein